MSNSSLVTYTKISPNKTSPRNHVIDTITIHCYVAQASVESAGNWFGQQSAKCSCNYMIGTDGRIALIVDEGDRSWCSSSAENDHRAVTIECASDKTHPYAVNEKVWDSLIVLCADICRRNGIKSLKWQGNKNLIGQIDKQNMTVHRWFKNKACPGEYLYSRHGQIAAEVNQLLLSGKAEGGYTRIAGKAEATAEQMQAYIKAKNPAVAQSVVDMIPFYLFEGEMEGVRGDVAFAQSCLETGNFTFSGSAVTLDQNNFCGMGVTQNGMKGNSFASPQLGIRAQVQHLKAYASTDALKNTCIDLRFQYVVRGCAPYVEWLGQKENPAGKGWATGAGYGEKILNILNAILAMPTEDTKEKTGWVQENEGWRYYLDSGHCVCNDWYQEDGKWYYFGIGGMMIESAWQQYKGGWYYLGIDGAMLTGLQTLGGKCYYFDQEGRMATEPILFTPDREGALHYTEMKK